jgi:hypothetical protein
MSVTVGFVIFYRGVESIHIDVNDLALPHRLGQGFGSTPFDRACQPFRGCIVRRHDRQAARPPSSVFSPLATIVRAPSASGR